MMMVRLTLIKTQIQTCFEDLTLFLLQTLREQRCGNGGRTNSDVSTTSEVY